jgi:hypothetical protein
LLDAVDETPAAVDLVVQDLVPGTGIDGERDVGPGPACCKGCNRCGLSLSVVFVSTPVARGRR